MEKLKIKAEGRWVVLCSLLLMFFTVQLRAETPTETFKRANQAYADANFREAATLYESVRAAGVNNWVLHYNLGNAYFKVGDTGRSAASYLRALRLHSSQPDVIFNLNLVLTRAGDPLLPDQTLSALFWRLFYWLSLNTLAALTAVLFIALCVGGTLFSLGRWRPPVTGAMATAISLVLIGSWFGVRVAIAEKKLGIVVSGAAEVRSGPNVSYPSNFTVPEGRRVLILDVEEPIKGWLQIGVPQEGLKGWIQETSVEAV